MTDDITYVYVIGREQGPVKVGISKNPTARLANLQGGCPFRLRILHKAAADSPAHAFAMEQEVHEVHQPSRLIGEWFNIDLEQAIEAIEICFDAGAYFKARAQREGVAWLY